MTRTAIRGAQVVTMATGRSDSEHQSSLLESSVRILDHIGIPSHAS
ncbi:hypothetical protein [Nocardia sp. NPDC052112]